MIVISQDKKRIYNFDNIKLIEVLNNDIFIIDDILADEGPFLGTYESEERAQEVLQEIVKSTIETRKSQEINSLFGGPGIIPSNTYYEMPEE